VSVLDIHHEEAVCLKFIRGQLDRLEPR